MSRDADRIDDLAARVRELDAELARADEVIVIYRDALAQIAGAESGAWGWRAHRALKRVLAVQAREGSS